MTIQARLNNFLNLALAHALLIGVSFFMILPFLWMLSTSLKPAAETFAHPPIIISPNFSLDAYITLVRDFHILRILSNTILIALSATVLQLLFCSLAGFAFAKHKFPGRELLFNLLLGTMIVPFVNLMVPLFLVMRNLHWIDTYWALIIPFAANAFGIFFMRQYISTISDELLDAARIDGAGEFGIYWRIILPIISPGLTSLGLIIFMSTWNSYLWPLVILKSPLNFTLPLLINSMGGTVGRTAWELTMAASVMSVVPLLILFLVFQRRYFEGITAGAVRG